MTSKQLINQLCYEYSTKNYNEEKLKTTHAIKKNLEILEQLETLKKYYPPFNQSLVLLSVIMVFSQCLLAQTPNKVNL